MSRKIINMPGARVSSHPTENAYRDRIHEIDYVTEEGKLVLDMFFSDGAFYITKCIHGTKQDIPEDMIFQRYEELDVFLRQFQGGRLYDNGGRLYFSGMPGTELLYEIRRITNSGENFLALKSYEMHQGIINEIWKENDYTEGPGLYAGGKGIRSMLFTECGDNTIYVNTSETHRVIESYAYKDDDGHYNIGGREKCYSGPVFNGESGLAAEISLEHLFDKGSAIIKDCSRNRFLLMGSYSQLSGLWQKSDHIEIKDEGGDLVIYCFKCETKAYMVRTITEAGMLYLDSNRPYPGLLDKIWENDVFSSRVYAT